MRSRFLYPLFVLTLLMVSTPVSHVYGDALELPGETAPGVFLIPGSTADRTSVNTAGSSSDEVSDMIVSDITALPLPEMEDETESEDGSLVETEMVYEIPIGITDGLKKDEPTGEAADMTPDERREWMNEICEANSPEKLWERHGNISASYLTYDEGAQMWKEFSCFYADPLVYYSDDWTPGLEELRLLIYDGSSCVEDYMNTMRFICFLNASEVPYRDPKTAPVTLDDDTAEEPLLKLYRSPEALYVVTQLTESSILHLGLEEPEEDSFYSCIYVLDPATLDVLLLQISLHDETGNVEDVERVSFSYDTGMTGFVETGYTGLLRHMLPGAAWAPEYLRMVTLTLDPATDDEKVFPLTVLKGDPVSITLPDGYALFSDEALTTHWVDDGNYSSDLNLWAAPEETLQESTEE